MQRYDIIGDVHGCYDELQELVQLLTLRQQDDVRLAAGSKTPSDDDTSRTLVFVGDLVDRGPRTPDVLRYVMNLVASGKGLCVRGNHDDKLLRYLQGKRVTVNNGLETSIAQLEQTSPAFRDSVRDFLASLPYYLMLNDGTLIVAHAGLEERLHDEAMNPRVMKNPQKSGAKNPQTSGAKNSQTSGAKNPQTSGAVRAFTLYGSTTGETDEYGLPVRLNWAADYKGTPAIVYGHTPVREPHWQNNTINIDTGCVFGGRLTALRYPERELVSMPAQALTVGKSGKVLPDKNP